MSDVPSGLETPPELRRRNLILGWIVGGCALLILAIAMWRFTVEGLPKDPDVVERMQQRQGLDEGAEGAEDRRGDASRTDSEGSQQ